MEEQFARKEKEQRRRKILLIEQKAQEKAEKDKVEQLMLDKIMHLSKQERRIAEQYVE